MKGYLFKVLIFMLIVFIIPLSAYSRNKNYLENIIEVSKKPDKNIVEVKSSSEENKKELKEDKENKIEKNTNIEESLICYTPQYNCNSFNIYDITENKVIKVSAEDYVIGAVASEMPPSFHEEALKAQAVACHSLAVKQKLDHMKNPDETLWGGDFSADPSNKKGYVTKEKMKEMYGDKFDLYYGKISKACQEVINKVMLSENEPVVAVYHSASNGFTEKSENVWSGGKSYLTTVESKGDILSPNYESRKEFTENQVKEILTAAYPDINLNINAENWFKDEIRSEAGYVLNIKVGDKTIEGKKIRSLFSLRSCDFDIKYENGNFLFTVRGYGHGVGLSQYGADYMARQGASYDEILKHYYRGVVIVDIK